MAYQAMTIAVLGGRISRSVDPWRPIVAFLKEFRWEPSPYRLALLVEEPAQTGDCRWDVFLAALADHLAGGDGHPAPSWTDSRALNDIWFPFDTKNARADAIVHVPAAFRQRGVFVARQELEVP